MAPDARSAMCGVCQRGWTRATAAGKMPSSAHANMRRDTESSIAGRSFKSAIAAPATMTTVQTGSSRPPSSPGAVRSRVAASAAT